VLLQIEKQNTWRASSPLIVNDKDGSLLVWIPAGGFEMGDGKDSDCPKHQVYLDGYYLGVYCITNRQYQRFVDETGHRPPDNTIWKNEEKVDHPVVDVSWDDVVVYCAWAGLQLPTEAQWEKGARGPGGLIYPWGNGWDVGRCRNNSNKGNGTTCRVFDYPAGVSGYGIYNMSGNVWEWCRDWYGSDYYKTSPRDNPMGPVTGSLRVNRGGGWDLGGAGDFRAAYRNRVPAFRLDYGGFRACLPPAQQQMR